MRTTDSPDPLLNDPDAALMDLASLSAADLVARLEADMAIVSAFETRRQAGAEALLRAALARAEAATVPLRTPATKDQSAEPRRRAA